MIVTQLTGVGVAVSVCPNFSVSFEESSVVVINDSENKHTARRQCETRKSCVRWHSLSLGDRDFALVALTQ